MEILQMNREELLALKPEDISRFFTVEEVVHIARTLKGYWSYDYEAAGRGNVGDHAELKSKLHSNSFFYSNPLLSHRNIRLIFANQIVMRLREAGVLRPDYVRRFKARLRVIGVPNGATKLGEDIAKILGTKTAVMKKVNGRIILKTPIGAEELVLLIEDFCTRGTGLIEAGQEIKRKQPEAEILPFNPVILNRGGLHYITVGLEKFTILPVVESKQTAWEKSKCPLCTLGSIAIKPKEPKENWQRLITSQL